jgi:catechol 2,3-dioxygenase-like lactoylglutathione lyase family enzyme
VDRPRFASISAVTLATHDMKRAVHFYRALGFELASGGETAGFTSFAVGAGYLNLIVAPREARAAGLAPEAPRDAEWGERYFHLTDPDGHELSFARPI